MRCPRNALRTRTGPRSKDEAAVRDQFGDEPAGCRRLRQAEMAVPESINDRATMRASGPMAGRLSGSDGRNPIHCLPPPVLKSGQESRRLPAALRRPARKFGGRSRPPSSTAPPTRTPVDSGVTTKPCAAEDELPPEVERAGRQGGVVAALGIERDQRRRAARERASTRRRRRSPPPWPQRCAVARNATPCAIAQRRDNASRTPCAKRAALRPRAARPCAQRKVVGIGHRLPDGHEGAGDELRVDRPGCSSASRSPRTCSKAIFASRAWRANSACAAANSASLS